MIRAFTLVLLCTAWPAHAVWLTGGFFGRNQDVGRFAFLNPPAAAAFAGFTDLSVNAPVGSFEHGSDGRDGQILILHTDATPLFRAMRAEAHFTLEDAEIQFTELRLGSADVAEYLYQYVFALVDQTYGPRDRLRLTLPWNNILRRQSRMNPVDWSTSPLGRALARLDYEVERINDDGSVGFVRNGCGPVLAE